MCALIETIDSSKEWRVVKYWKVFTNNCLVRNPPSFSRLWHPLKQAFAAPQRIVKVGGSPALAADRTNGGVSSIGGFFVPPLTTFTKLPETCQSQAIDLR